MKETASIYSPYGGYHEGDFVTRDGSDVQLVKDMTSDGFAATFVCVVAPLSGWCAVGDEENNACRRYERVTRNAETGAWELTPGHRQWEYIDPFDLVHKLAENVCREMTEIVKSLAVGTVGGAGFARAWSDRMHLQKSRAYYRRNPKRRALRK